MAAAAALKDSRLPPSRQALRRTSRRSCYGASWEFHGWPSCAFLLNASHPDNGGKAQFFQALGYSASDVALLAEALRQIAVAGETVDRIESRHGTKYVVVGEHQSRTVGGRNRVIRTVWIVESGSDAPRLVTAYPEG